MRPYSMEGIDMATYKLLENDNLALTVPLSGCSEDLDRQELKDNLIETMKDLNGIGLSQIWSVLKLIIGPSLRSLFSINLLSIFSSMAYIPYDSPFKTNSTKS